MAGEEGAATLWGSKDCLRGCLDVCVGDFADIRCFSFLSRRIVGGGGVGSIPTPGKNEIHMLITVMVINEMNKT